MHKIPNKTCDCTASFIELTIQCLYIVFNIYEKGKFVYNFFRKILLKINLFISYINLYCYYLERESYDIDLLKLMEEIVENSYSILYRLGKLDEEFRSHISKCKGRFDVIVRKIQKLEFGKTNSKNHT